MFSKNDVFLKNNLLFFAGSMLVAFFNYLFYPVLSRFINLADFGEVQVLISLSAQLAIFLGGLSLVTVTMVANWEDKEECSIIISLIQKLMLLLSFFLFIFVIVFSQTWKSFFNFSSYLPFISLAFLLPLGVVFTIRTSVLQGKNDFKSLAVANLIVAIGRLFLAIILVYIGWRTLGAITGIVLAQIIGLGYVVLKTRKYLLHYSSWRETYLKHKANIKSGLKYIFFVFLGLGLMTFLYSGDVLIVKHYFTPDEAGLYSGISIIAKIIFFATASFTAVLLPNLKLKNTLAENKKLLFRSLVLVGLVGLVAVILFLLLPKFVISVLIGSRYLPAAYLLSRLSILMLIVSFINVFLFYFLALRKYFFVVILALGIGVMLLFSYLFHSGLETIVNNILVAAILVLLGLGIFSLKKYYV